jgi:hypothetical protein
MMSDLRRRLHAAAATPDSELDTEALTTRAIRRRQRRAIAVVAAAAVVVIAAGGGVLAARDGAGNDTLRTRGTGSETTLAPSTSAPSTSTSTTTSTTIATTPGTNATVPPAGGGPSWQAAPTTGIGNFTDVTITATGIPNGTYDVGQCPKDLPDGPTLSSCLLHAVINVSDGNLTANVRAFWWMNSGRVDCGAAPGTCVVGFMSGDPRSTFTPVSFDLVFDPALRPRIEVTPSTGLADGQQIEVRGFNIGAGSVSFAECLGDQWGSCAYASATAGADGNFVATYSVQRVLYRSYHGTLEEAGECGVDGGCVITAFVTPAGFEDRASNFREFIEPNGPVAIAFSPAPPPTTTTTTP